MLKRIIIAALVALPMSLMAQKFGFVDVPAVFNAMPEIATAQAQLQTASQNYENEFKKLQEELDKKYAEFQALAESTPQTIKERRLQEIQDLQQKSQEFANSASQDLQRQQQQLMAPIEQKVNDAIQSVGAEGGFTYIIQKDQMPYVGADVIDVTPLVKTKLGIK